MRKNRTAIASSSTSRKRGRATARGDVEPSAATATSRPPSSSTQHPAMMAKPHHRRYWGSSNFFSSGCISTSGRQGPLERLVDDLPLVRDQGLARQFIIQVELRSAVAHQVQQVIRDGPGVHLAGV